MEKLTAEERFMSKVDTSGECWEWTGAIKAKGYGAFWQNGRSIRAHRFSWELHCGPIPDGLMVLHHCDNRRCVRPEHLFLGTAQDNILDAYQKGRVERHKPYFRNTTNHPRGETHVSSILTENDVREIRQLRSSGELTFKEIGSQYGVSRATVEHIVYRRTWNHVH